MDDKPKERRGLKRGLSTLMGETRLVPEEMAVGTPRRSATILPVEKIVPNPKQPRKDFGRDGLESLAASIREKGIIQPLVVRPDPENPDRYQIVTGERRWQAAQLAQLHDVPVVVRELSDSEAQEFALIENIQRTDLNPVEEAGAYRQLMNDFGHTHEELSQTVSKSRPHITNLLRLLKLPEDVQEFLKTGQISAGHGRTLVGSEDPSGLARHVIEHELSVRKTEELVKRSAEEKGTRTAGKPEKDADTRMLEGELSANIGMTVTVDHKSGRENGRVVIRYKTLDELDSLRRILTAMPPGDPR